MIMQARNVLQIPVPRVYSWNAQPDNPVGAEYIVMEEAPGTMLDSIWVELPLEERINIMKDLISIEKKLLSVSFSKYDFSPINLYLPATIEESNLYCTLAMGISTTRTIIYPAL